MGRCQKSTVRGKGGTTCGKPTASGKRYCAQHMGGKRPGGSRKRKAAANDGCGGMLLLMLTALLLVVLGIVM
ncbi:hypothetical protein [Embleya hyalina]|uniref:Uncharacterized protein n=1 Tax=Embleya hyalina TaxID=516124 RepID=A0A401YET5_9ACTN|nr:hypothetical protein [Embleya hyalina]GCD93113.1 hypothetical protein EHYA_00756 [Embleya hyalina]